MINQRYSPTFILTLSAILFCSTAHAGPTLGPVDNMTSAQTTQLWKLHWKSYADAYAKVGDQYFMNPNWDRRYPSSIKMTPTQWQRENTTKKRVPAPGGLTKLDFSAPVREEVVAAVYALPELEVGHWGRLHSVYVDEKLDRETVVGTAIYLVDRQQIEEEIKQAEERGREMLIKQAELERIEREKERKRYQGGNRDRTRGRNNDRDERPKITAQQIKAEIDERYQHRRELIKKQDRYGTDKIVLKGFDTSTAGKGKRWNGNGPEGIEIVVVGRYALPQEKSSTSRFVSSRSNMVLVGVPRKAFEETMKEEDFAELLKTRGFTPEQFVVMVRDSLRDQKPDDARDDVLRMIEKTSTQQLKLGQPDDGEKIASGDQPTNNTPEEKPRELSLEEKLAQMLKKDQPKEGESADKPKDRDKPEEGDAKPDRSSEGDKPQDADKPKEGDKPAEGDAPKDKESNGKKKSLEQQLKELQAKSKEKSD